MVSLMLLTIFLPFHPKANGYRRCISVAYMA